MQNENDVEGYNYRTKRAWFRKQLKPKAFGRIIDEWALVVGKVGLFFCELKKHYDEIID